MVGGQNSVENFNDRLVSLAAAAQVLSVSNRTIRRLVDRGELVACKVLGSVRIPLSVLKSYYRRITNGLELREGL